MIANAQRSIEEYRRSIEFASQISLRRREATKQASRDLAKIKTVIVVEFRDEVFASIDLLFRRYRLVAYRAKSTSELAGVMVRHQAELVVLNATQPDESAWLTAAKLRIIDAYRSVWVYTPGRPNALDEWLSMVGTDDVIVYGGVLQSLLDSLQIRLSFLHTAAGRMLASNP
jgi:hypothetical protein